MNPLVFPIGVAVAGVILVAFICLEGARQRRKMGGKPTGTGSPLMRTGMLELQSLLEPEKKIEMLVKEEAPMVQEESGAPPQPGPLKPPES